MIKRYKENEIDDLVIILKNNGVISVPTDTVYGLCAQISSIDAYNNLLIVKNRPKTKLFPIMCANKEQIKNITYVDSKVEKIIDALMPGPITLILNKKEDVLNYIDSNTIAVRMATSKILENIINKLGCPVFMTSANQSGQSECKNLDEIESSCPKLNGMLEGTVTFNQASTIVDCTLDEIKIIRSGPITLEKILNVIEKEYNTLKYYDENALEYCNQTLEGNLKENYERFLTRLPKDAYILDFGCGSGRDSKYFIDNNYKVKAIDGSIKMCEFASKYINQEVECIKFNELSDKNIYDGIWACSSILHVEKENVADILIKMYDALKENGIIYTSFKIGKNYEIKDGKYYNYLTKEELEEVLKSTNKNLKIIDYFETLPSTKRKDINTIWGNFIIKKY